MPTDDSRAVATGDVKQTEPTVDELDVDLEALAKAKPLLVYYYVDPISDPMDENYKFSRKFELSVLGESVNQLTTYGFDTVTHMQETKCTLCQIEAFKA